MAEPKPAAYGAPAAQALVASTTDRVRPNAKLIALLSLGHFVVDLNQGSLPAVLPFLKSAHQLSYASAATIVLAANVASSLVQPLFGYFADQTARRWMLPASVFLTGVGFALMGLAPGYAALLALVIVMGLGVAAYHPEGYRTATSVAGERKATALSWFSLGGNVGYASGPLIAAFLITTFGLGGTLGMLVPSAIMTLAIVAMLPAMARASTRETAVAREVRGVSMPKAMALLVVIGSLRSWSSLGFVTFVPFYFVDYLKADPGMVGAVLFVLLGSGALGTVLAGPIADRWGARPLV